MRLNVSTSIDVTACETDGDNLLFLGFHGFSNDENEMIRIIDAIYDVPKQDVSSTDNPIASAQHPKYPGMAHGICNQEIHDLRAWLGL